MNKKQQVLFLLKIISFEMYQLCHNDNDELNEEEWHQWQHRMEDLISKEDFIYEMENVNMEYELELHKV